MKKIVLLSTIILGISFIYSCSGDWLDTKPTSSTATSTIFETTQNAALAVNGLSKMMSLQYIGSQGFNGEGTIKMYHGNYPGNNFFVNLPGWANTCNGTYHDNLTATYTVFPWYYYYKIIGNANSIILNIDDAAGPDSEKEFIKAQALTFRAYCYLMLAQLYSYRWVDSNNGSANGVVLRLDSSDGDMPLSTLAETYAQIYADLDEAISLYTSSRLNRKYNYEMNIDVAYAVYARAALTRQDYATALSMASKARAGYALMSVADYRAGFCNPTSEWIWSIWGSSDETLYFYSYFAYIAYSSTASAVRTTPKCISRELFEKIPKSDIRRALFLDPEGYTYTTSTGVAGAPLAAYARELFPDLDPTATIYAYMQFKINLNDQAGVGHLNNFRSSEMLLTEAEAKYFLNDIAGAQNALNELNRTSGRDPEYNCTATGTDLLNEIKIYRGLELWGEGFDWFDMKRWNDPIVRHTYADGGNYIDVLAVTVQPAEVNKWTWMIPRAETDFNKAI